MSSDMCPLAAAFKTFSALPPAQTVETMSSGILVCPRLLNLPEDFLSEQQVRDENPNSGGHKVLGQVFSVGLAVCHPPAEGKVLCKHFVANVHKNRVHTCSRITHKEEGNSLDQHQQNNHFLQ